MIDISPLEPIHLTLFLAVFIVVFIGTRILVSLRPKILRVQKKDIVYAGWYVAAAVTAFAFFAVPDTTQSMGLLAAAVIIILIGRLDETRDLSARRQLVWQCIIAAVVTAMGWTVPYVSNVWGEGVVMLEHVQFAWWTLPGGVIAFFLILLFINAINWIDGVDGLASGVGLVAFVSLATVSLLPSVQDPVTLTLSLIGAGGLLGFVLWNAPPARAYLGASGSWFLGLYLALVAMYGGGKIASALIVLALPTLDALFVIAERIRAGTPPWKGDTSRHIHHRLRAKGFSDYTIVLLAVCVTVLLAGIGVFAPTQVKIWALGIVAGFFVVAFVSRCIVSLSQ